jgi:hypothetical protein
VIDLTGAAANEAEFKEQASGRRVLHLATHGFFLAGRCPSALESARGVGGVKAVAQDEPPPVTGDNPLLLSGLALAGANHRAKAGPEEDDGILTAEEIAAMNLSGVEWAVLSACETGVGKVEAGEGVFGLRRAFQMAGAGTLIMSLWSVEDESARQWMRALYEGRLVKKLSTAESVRAASLEVLRSRREKGQSTHPFFREDFFKSLHAHGEFGIIRICPAKLHVMDFGQHILFGNVYLRPVFPDDGIISDFQLEILWVRELVFQRKRDPAFLFEFSFSRFLQKFSFVNQYIHLSGLISMLTSRPHLPL